MRESSVRAAGLALAILYASVIGWMHVRQPASAAQVSGGLASFVHAYRIDQQAFDDGVRFFHQDQFEAARSAFARADPAQRDARTQFYIAYAHYRQGWGRLYHDRTHFAAGLEAVNRAMDLSPGGRIVVDDPQIQMHSGDELKAELVEGLAQPTHPMSVLRPRK